jgi:subtilase family serine protease
MLSFCSNCSGWLLTLAYQPKFCTRCGSPIGRVVPLLEYAILAAVAAAVVLAII